MKDPFYITSHELYRLRTAFEASSFLKLASNYCDPVKLGEYGDTYAQYLRKFVHKSAGRLGIEFEDFLSFCNWQLQLCETAKAGRALSYAELGASQEEQKSQASKLLEDKCIVLSYGTFNCLLAACDRAAVMGRCVGYTPMEDSVVLNYKMLPENRVQVVYGQLLEYAKKHHTTFRVTKIVTDLTRKPGE